jgi:Carboxypeptidase regulatory-like domain/TonB dependent receptor/TonB-dependent Receptor Plug Domain
VNLIGVYCAGLEIHLSSKEFPMTLEFFPKRLAALCVAVLFLMLAAAQARAQFDTATVLGTVQDATGAILPRATVTLRNLATGITQTAQTDENGAYQFFNVKIGTYQVSAEASGFSKGMADNIQVTVNARQRVDLALKAGAVTETVVITGGALLLETESSDRGQVIQREQIVNLPLNGRAYADLALLAPGVRRSVLNNQESGGRDASFNVNGLRSSLNNFIIDGVDNNAYGTSNQGFSNQVVQASPDAVQEFKVQTNNFSAEFGRAGGAVINASIRSGTNEFHGSAYNFLRNTSLNATGFFKPTRGVKPVLIQNQFGGAFGGPIVKDKTFFFANYEGFRRITRSLQFATVPTAAQRAGQLGVAVRNPFTGVVYQDGNIPANEITPFARSVMSALVLPVTSPNAAGVVSNNYEDLPRSQFYNDKFDVKLDHNFGSRLTGFVRVSHRKVNNFEAPVIPAPVFSSANAFVRVLNQQLAGGITYNVSSTSLLEFRLGVSRTEAGKQPTGLGDPNFRLPGLPTDPGIAGGLNTQNIGGYTGLGRQSSNPQYQDPFVWNPRINYTWVLGRHSLKAGYEYQRINTVIEDFNPKYGQDSYGGQFSRPANITAANNIYNLADFLFGARSRYELANLFEPEYRQRMHFGYLQDDFKVSPKLTLNLGVRYEFATPQYEEQNRLSNFDPAARKLIFASDGSLANRALVAPDANNWAPRLGLAYSLTPGTVLRGGYGVSYIHFNRLGGENILAFNLPQIVGVTIDQLPSTPLCTGDAFQGCFRPTQTGYPAGLISPARASTLNTRTNFTPRETRTGYVQSWHLTVQRELIKGLLLDVGYVGNHSVKLIALGDYNQARTVTAEELRLSNLPANDPNRRPLPSIAARRPLADFGFVQASFNGGFANYHALQVKLERRFSAGLYLLNSFTWSKAIDNAAGHLESQSGDNSRLNIRNIGGDRGLSNYNQPINNTTSVVYDLPFGKGRRFAIGSTALDTVIGGWRATLINTMNSGLPVNLTYGAVAGVSVGGTATLRPNLTGQALRSAGVDPTNYLTLTGVSIPTGDVLFGNAGRNTLRGPNFFQADLGLHKSFPVWRETTKLEFRMEAFNLFNRTNFGVPDGNASNIRVVNGQITTGGSYGTIRNAFPARQIQFALKLYF